jgi:O-antigen/teichoic acid export membrane protein
MLGILTASLLTFVISPAEVGAYNLALSIVSFGALVGALGLPKTVVRLVAENVGLNRSGRARRVIYTVLGVVGTLLTSLAYFLGVGDLIERRLFDSPLLVGITGLIAIWIAIAIVQEITAETFRGFHDLRWATLLGGLATGGKSGGLIMRLILLACLALLWSTGAGVDLKTVMLVSIGAGSVSVLLSCWLLYRRVSSLGSGATEEDAVSTREVLDDAVPFLAIAMTAFVLQAADRCPGLDDGGRRLQQRLQAGHLRGDAAPGGKPRDAAHRRGDACSGQNSQAGAHAARL